MTDNEIVNVFEDFAEKQARLEAQAKEHWRRRAYLAANRALLELAEDYNATGRGRIAVEDMATALEQLAAEYRRRANTEKPAGS